MKKLYIFLILILSFVAPKLEAQSDILFTHFMFNKLNYNPAFAGNAEVLDVAALYRNQWWSGIEGAPTTLNLFGHTPIMDGSSGVGLSISSDKIGFHETLSAEANYAYRIEIDRNSKLSIGLSARFEQSRTKWQLAQGVRADDPMNGTNETSKIAPNFGFGAYYKAKNYYAGISVPRLLKNSLYSEDAEFSLKQNTYFYYKKK